MDQVWWIGPIAEKTGDIGFEVGSYSPRIRDLLLDNRALHPQATFIVTGLIYVPLRLCEQRLIRR